MMHEVTPCTMMQVHADPTWRFGVGISGLPWSPLWAQDFPWVPYLAIALGVGFPLGSGVASVIQAHGHVQLVGWGCLSWVSVCMSSPGWPGFPLRLCGGLVGFFGSWLSDLACAVWASGSGFPHRDGLR
jgi:hypothetical protein